MEPTSEVTPLSADIQSPPIATTSECIPEAPLTTSTSTTSTLTQPQTPTSETISQARPIVPLPIRAEGAAGSPLASPSATRISSRARKPSAKVVEMAEAGPSRPIPMGSEPKVEAKPQPRFLQPDHFSELNNGAKPPCYGRSRWEPDADEDRNELSPEDDPLALRGIPVFKPTIEEFQDFEGYINRTSPWGMKSGIAKIIPPPEWTGTLPPMSPQTLSQVHIKSPIQQNMMGTAGIFRAQNIEKNKTRPLSVKEWYEKCQNEKFVGPSPKIIDRDSREALAARVEAANAKKEKWAKKKEEKQKRREEREELLKFAEGPKEDVEMVEPGTEADAGDGLPALDAPSSGSSHSSPDQPMTPAEERVDEWYRTTDFNTAWLPKGTTLEDFTVEACTKLQKEYWKTMGQGEPSWYGADLMQGSLFADVNTKWNVAHLPNLLDRINCVLPGVNESYLYFGMWRATFAWHVEDMDLFSINYIHFGAPKFWYAIPQAQADHFERFLATQFPLDVLECDQFIRHKSIAISPTRLKDAQTRVNMIVHNQGEFMITYPRGYHAGFNLGFNCAESVNFATDDWVEIGRKAKVCQCVDYRIEMVDVLDKAQESISQEKGEGGIKRVREDAGEDGETRPAKTPKKRIRKPKSSMDISIVGEGPVEDSNAIDIDAPTAGNTTLLPSKSRISVQPKPAKIKKERPVYYCLFCPSLSPVDLCQVYEPNDFVKSQWKGQPGGTIAAHLNCAQSTPECYFLEEEVDGVERIWIMGANDVVKDRWNKLKCKLCPDKARAASGVKVQCTKGKCPAAYHYSCAKANDNLKTELWQVEEWLPAILPADAPPGTEAPLEKVSNVKLELLCPSHNPAQKEIKEREKAEEVRQRVLEFRPGQMIKVKQGSGCFEYKLVSIDEEKREIEVQLYGEKTSRVPWSRVDFRGLAPVKKVENDYARHHVTSRKAEGLSEAVETKKVKAPSVVAGAGTRPIAPAPAPAPPARVIHPPPGPGSNPEPLPRSVSNSHTQPAQPPRILHPSQPAPPPRLTQPAQPPPQYQPHPAGYAPYLARPDPPRASSSSQGPPGGWPLPGPPLQQPQYQLPPPGYMMNPYDRTPSPGYGYPHPDYIPPQYGGGPPPSQYGHYAPGVNNGYYPPSYPPQTYPPPPQNAYYYPPPPPHPGYTFQIPQPHPGMEYGYPGQQPQLYRPVKPVPPPVHSDPRVHAHSYGGAVRTSAQQPRQQSASGPSGMQHLMNPSVFQPPTTSESSDPSRPPSTSSGVGRIDLGLGRMQQLMRTIKPLTTPAIHIAGTNGKGSVSAMIESSLLLAGFRTARYNSPHLLEPRDAIRMNGKPVNAPAYNRAIRHFGDISSQLDIKATTFEIATAAAYALISEYNPDIMIIECGMGGSRDATNVIPPHLVLATILTSVGLDHTAFLGETVEAITEEKSSIAVKDALFVVARQSFENARSTACLIGRQRGARTIDTYPSNEIRDPSTRQPDVSFGSYVKPYPLPVYFTLPQPDGNSIAMDVNIPLPGAHQVDNASTAITVLSHLRTDPRALKIQPKFQGMELGHIQSGIERTKWAGRCSWLDYTSNGSTIPILVDGAHNSDSATSLRNYIDTCLPKPSPVTFIIGLSDSKGKSPDSVLKALLRPGDKVAIVEFKGPVEGMPWIKATPKTVLESVIEGLIGSEDIWRGEGALREALEWGRGNEGMVVVCGSLYLVADVYRLLGLEDEI